MTRHEFEALLTSAERLLLKPAPFEQWLNDKPADAFVGMRGDCASCPLHTFLMEHLQPPAGLQITVGSEQVQITLGATGASGARHVIHKGWFRPQPWAAAFIVRVDRALCDTILAANARLVMGEARALCT